MNEPTNQFQTGQLHLVQMTRLSQQEEPLFRFSWNMTVLKLKYAHEKRSCHEQTTSYGPASLRPDSTKTLSGKPGAVQPVDTQSSFSQVCLLGRPVPEARTEAVRHGRELLVMHRRRPDQA